MTGDTIVAALTSPGGKIETLIKRSLTKTNPGDLDGLFEKIINTVINEMRDHCVMPAFRAWKKHEIITLNDMEDAIKRNVKIHFNSENGSGKKALEPIIKGWMDDLSDDIQKITDPICLKYRVPTEFMRLNLRSVDIQAPDNAAVNPDDFLLINAVKNVVGFIAAFIAALIVLILIGTTGPIGIIIGAIAAFFAAFGAKYKVINFVKSSDIPSWVRASMSEKTVADKLSSGAKYEEMKNNVLTKMREDLAKPTEEMQKLVDGILSNVRELLKARADKLAMLIR